MAPNTNSTSLSTLASKLLCPLLLVGACAAPGADDYQYTKSDGKNDASADAVFLEFTWQGLVVASNFSNAKDAIDAQLLYTIGQLNGDNSIGRLDKVELQDIERTTLEDGRRQYTYSATMPVAWGKQNDIPQSYTLKLPADLSSAGQRAFTEAYSHSCVDFGAHDVDESSMWYYYRPERYNCHIDANDIVALQASIAPSPTQTTGKFPEYDKVWEDNELKVVAIFGKYEDNATNNTDAGISAYNRFLRSVSGFFPGDDIATMPLDVPSNPGVELPEVRYSVTLENGKSATIDALLVDNVRTAGLAFNNRFGELSRDADLIIYNGHAGLGANIRALARKGDWVTGQYTIFFMNGCDTYAYVDSALYDSHAAVNDDDNTGSKYVDVVTNAMPSFFSSMSAASGELIKGLAALETPKTYEQLFADVDSAQVILVSGEEDNQFQPGAPEDPPIEAWEGTIHAGDVDRNAEFHVETPVLPAGTYVFDLTGTNDADLYVRIGSAPSEDLFDCRPFLNGSRETCTVELSQPAQLFAMVRGWAQHSEYELEAFPVE